jgi:hypothetical protein
LQSLVENVGEDEAGEQHHAGIAMADGEVVVVVQVAIRRAEG